MAGFLSTLLHAKEPMFSYVIAEMEKSVGCQGIDVRLISDIRHQSHEVMRKIGLDPADTTPYELYKALSSCADEKDLFSSTDFVGVIIDGEVISLNYEDIECNIKANFSKRSIKHMICCLEVEIISRYENHERTDARVVRRFAEHAGLAMCKLDEYHVRKHADKPKEKKEKS